MSGVAKDQQQCFTVMNLVHVFMIFTLGTLSDLYIYFTPRHL